MIDLGLEWANRHYSWLFIVLFFIVFLILWNSFTRRKLLKRLKLSVENNSYNPPKWRLLKNILLVIGLLWATIAMIGPQWGEGEEQYRAEGLDMCIALDLSQSMNAEDVSPSRLKLAKNQLSIFLKTLGGDRVTLVGFAGSAYVAAPLTVDYHSFIDFMEPITTEFISDQATNLGAGVDGCLGALGVENLKDPEDLEFEAAKVIVLVSDGEDTVEEYKGAIEKAKSLDIPIFSMAIGTAQGANIPIRDSRGSLEGYVRDPESRKPVTSKLLDKGLLDLAELTKAKVFYSSQGIQAWEYLLKALKNYKRNSSDAGKVSKKEHRFQIPLIIAFLLLLIDFLIPETRFFWKKLLLPCLIALSTHHSNATPVNEVVDIYKNNQGIKHFSQQEYKEADKLFSDIISNNPESFSTRFNWLSNRLHQMRSEVNENEKKSEEQDSGKSDDINISPDRIEPIKKELYKLLENSNSEKMRKAVEHQLAQSQELSGNNKEALLHYYKSMKGSEWIELDEKSRNNIARLITKEDQKKKQSQEGEGKGKGGGGGGQGKDGKDPNSNKKYEQGSNNKARFDETNLDAKQAKEILSSVSSEEKEVQQRKAQAEAAKRAKKQRQQGRGTGQRGKPW